MEQQTKLLFNGQQLQLDDVNALGESAGLADDRTLAELLRLAPFDGTTVARGIMPYCGSSIPGQTATTYAVRGVTSSGAISVQPFRAVIGSRTTAAAGAKVNWRDIRSAICVGSTTLAQTYPITPNASGNPRWDLLYAAVTPDVQLTSVIRKIKSPQTKVIAATNISAAFGTTVTLGMVQGTPAASPVWPAAPADGSGVYYVPIAYLRVINGFTASSTLTSSSIAMVANMLGTGPVEGTSFQIAQVNQLARLTTTQQQSFGSTGNAPLTSAPSVAQGTESLFVHIDASTALPSVALNGGVTVLDSSRDWSNRYFRVLGTGGPPYSGANSAAPHRGGTGGLASGAGGNYGSTPISGTVMGASFGPSMLIFNAVPAGGTLGTPIQALAAGTSIAITANGTGQLVCTVTGQPNAQLVLWIEASPRFEV